MIPPQLHNSLRTTLLSGGYNLLVGSGISLDSENGLGERIRGAEQLRRDLCALTTARDTTTLPRVCSLLSPAQRRAELVDRFNHCRPAPSLAPLSRFLWRRLFTFNIDDVVEALYVQSPDAKQKLRSCNFDDELEPTPDRRELLAVHLHGWVGKEQSGFVFSHAEYAQSMRSRNPWMHLLAGTLATEPFIIAGTSLNEVDLEYYLSHRTAVTPRRGSGPSFLIEPSPDIATVADCKRYGLTLVEGTFAQFLAWLQEQFPTPPTLAELMLPDVRSLFPDRSLAPKLLRFFSDFRLIVPSDQPRSSIPSSFLYGRAPSQADLDQHIDIPRADNDVIRAHADNMLASKSGPRLLIVFGDAGIGKSTVTHRVGHDIARMGRPAITVHTLSRIDAANASECVNAATTPLILVVDGIADHAEQILELMQRTEESRKLVVLASERSYRREYIDVVFGGITWLAKSMQPLCQVERRQLIELLRQYGLVASADALRRPDEYAARLSGEPAAIAVCRILNDFRPLEAIVESLWNASDSCQKLPYLCAALARHCHVAGVKYSILQTIVGKQCVLSDLFLESAALRLSDNEEDDEYVVPINAVIGERALHRAVIQDKQLLLQAFSRLAFGLAPHVNRVAIMRRSPEARLSGRLFDADKIVRPLLGTAADEWYVSCQEQWEWNSRYWEQRALVAADEDLETALQYARHAVALEKHPFTLTTLGKLLLRRVDLAAADSVASFADAFDCLSEAIWIERQRSRITVHPFSTMFLGAARFIDRGGQLDSSQEADLRAFVAEARQSFPTDMLLKRAIGQLDSVL